MVASGALAFKGLGWWWERPLVWFGLIKPEIFDLVVLKSLTRLPRKGNLCWWKPWTWLPWSPWSCVRFLKNGGAVNKVGLTNKGIGWFVKKVAPKLKYKKYKLAASFFGTREELVEMVQMLNPFDFVAYELNVSCPNSGHALSQAEETIETVKAVYAVSRRPLIVKVSKDQDYLAIAAGVKGYAQALSFNSVPWAIWTFSNQGRKKSPLWRLEKKVSGGGGGVSGKPAQSQNWSAMLDIVERKIGVPVIASSIMNYNDIAYVQKLGAAAVSFGTIHMRTPRKATQIVLRHKAETSKEIKEFAGKVKRMVDSM